MANDQFFVFEIPHKLSAFGSGLLKGGYSDIVGLVSTSASFLHQAHVKHVRSYLRLDKKGTFFIRYCELL